MQVFSPKQVARAIGASESSVKRWCDRGLMPSVKTGGGHRRVPLSGLLEFVRAENRVLVSPVELGLPTEVGQNRTSLENARAECIQALGDGNYAVCRRVLFDLYLAKHTIGQICDEILSPALRTLGDGWCDGTVEVFAERRGCELALRLIYEMRAMVPNPPGSAPVAMGASVEKDPYSLPTRMVELALIESGWNAISLGCGVPLSSLRQAIVENKPRLFWLSVSAVEDHDQFVEQYTSLFSACDNVAVVVGGRGLVEDLRSRIEYSAFCENLQRLETFSKAMLPQSESN